MTLRPATLYIQHSFLLYCSYLSSSQVAMRALGFEVKKADVLKVMRDYDREETGKITFDDFKEVSKSAK